MADIDLHTHSRFFHAFPGRPTVYDPIGLRLHVAVARMRDLDAIAVTNHDYYEPLEIETGDLTILPGIEISTTEGHLLVVGPDPPTRTKPGMISPETAVELAHDRGCAAVMAHPYRNSRLRDSDLNLDAIEVNGKRSTAPEMIADLARERGLPLVGGSDAHYPVELGRTYSIVDTDTVTPESVVEAIRQGRTDYRIAGRRGDSAIQRLYGLVHRLRGQNWHR